MEKWERKDRNINIDRTMEERKKKKIRQRQYINRGAGNRVEENEKKKGEMEKKMQKHGKRRWGKKND